MSDARSYKEQSRRDWHRDGGPTTTDLGVGCLQRIADATEAMSRPFVSLLEQVERERKWSAEQRQRIEERDRTIAALRGQVTKARNRLAAVERVSIDFDGKRIRVRVADGAWIEYAAPAVLSIVAGRISDGAEVTR